MNYHRQDKEYALSAAEMVVRRREKTEYDWMDVAEEMRGALTVDQLSEDQKVVFDEVLKWYHGDTGEDVLTIGGYAGTGKSTLTAVIASALIQKYQGMHIAFCAYTGKAANVLKQKLRLAGIRTTMSGYPHYAGTIHGLIYKPMLDDRGEVVTWARQEDLDYTLIIIDEASMVDEKMLEDLLGYHIPILAVGDHGQLLPVKGISSLMVNPDMKLERIHRQAQGSPIIQLSQQIRADGYLPEKWTDDEHVQFINFDQFTEKLAEVYKTAPPADVAILTYTNKCRQNMNYYARSVINQKDMDSTPIEGDQFICLRNTKGAIFNGMRGRLEGPPIPRNELWYEGKFFFPDDSIEVEGWAFRPQMGRDKTFASWEEIKAATGRSVYSWNSVGLLFDYGYALTVHKAQGSQFKHVFLIFEQPSGAAREEFKRWLYTGVTRASQHLYIVVG